MKIIYSRRFEERYQTNPVENPDRVRIPALDLMKSGYDFIEPRQAAEEDIRMVHSQEHVTNVRRRGLYEAASWAAGGAIVAAEQALAGVPAFALIRPPGHHASASRAWGLCFFNNMAIAVRRIMRRMDKVLIIDIDLHFGDGTVSIFRGDSGVKIVNPGSVDKDFDYLSLDSHGYLKQIETALQGFEYDVIGVSAGFDTYIEDWGGLLTAEDYEKIGRMIAEASEQCEGRRFAVLEGGYHPDLKLNINKFIKGFD